MIITRTPFRITLGGGGTDLPSYYNKYGGYVVSAAINKFMYIFINKPILDNKIRVKYSLSETVDNIDDLKHDIAREALRFLKINDSIEIVSIADIPSGTGLGSSSTYAVGLLNGLHYYKKNYISLHELAEEACKLEINILKKPIGKQDQFIASFGGISILDISKNGNVKIKSINIDNSILDDLNQNLLLFYTQSCRSTDAILIEQSEKAKKDDFVTIESLHKIKEIGYQIVEAIESGNLTEIGILFDKHWNYKKQLSNQISNRNFDYLYDLAKENGAIGGKITGAGGGGFFIFYCESKRKHLIDILSKNGLKFLSYRFNFDGSIILSSIN